MPGYLARIDVGTVSNVKVENSNKLEKVKTISGPDRFKFFVSHMAIQTAVKTWRHSIGKMAQIVTSAAAGTASNPPFNTHSAGMPREAIERKNMMMNSSDCVCLACL